jgi:hypothetical protein
MKFTGEFLSLVFNIDWWNLTRNVFISIGCSFKFIPKAGVQESIVNAPQIADHALAAKSNLTVCVGCVFTLQTDEWSVHNRLFEDKFK